MGMIGYLREVSDLDLQQLDDDLEAYNLFQHDDRVALCLEKDWHALHYLLTGSTEGGGDPLGFLLTGGHEVGSELGYGRPRLLDSTFVQRLDKALQGITEDQFWSRFDAQRFEAEEIYPGNWGDEPPDSQRDAFVPVFNEVRGYVARVAAAEGQMVVVIV